MTFSAKDLERWTAFLEDKSHGQEVPPSVGAQLIADVRREALEEAAVVAETFDAQATNQHFIQSRKHIARRIRALKDGGK